MIHFRTLPIAALSLLPTTTLLAQDDAPASQPTHGAWIADYDEALAKARAEKKDLLVDFTGSDWCGWCIRLDKEVFAHEAFLKPATEKFVLCALDFPNDPEIKAKVPNPQRNQELQKKYSVQGFPTILVIGAADEVVLGRTGYRPGGPESYVTHLDELLTEGKAALADVARLTKAFETADDQVAVLTEAATRLGEMTAESPGVAQLAELVGNALELDATQFADLRKAAILGLLKSGQASDDVAKAGEELDPRNTFGILEQVIAAEFRKVQDAVTALAAVRRAEQLEPLPVHDKELGLLVFANAARWAASPQVGDDAEAAKRFANKALGMGVDDPRMKQMLEQIAGKKG